MCAVPSADGAWVGWDFGCRRGRSLGHNVEWMRWPIGRSLGAGGRWDVILGCSGEIAGMRCWGAGDDDRSVIESDIISNEREDLLATLWGAGSSWDATFGSRGKIIAGMRRGRDERARRPLSALEARGYSSVAFWKQFG